MQTTKDKALASVALITAAGVLGYLLALLEHALVANFFGATGETDAFFAAASVPALIESTLLTAAIGATFIPIFVDLLKRNRDDAMRTANIALNLLLTAGTALAVIGMLTAPWLVRLVAPGLPPETQTHSASLLTILFPNVLLVALVALFKAYLNAQHRFAVPALAQVLVPGTIALALILLAQRIGIDCMAFGSVAGWGLALLAVVAAAYRSGFRYRWVLDLRSPPIRQMTRLFPPVVIGSVATSMVILTNQIMASLLPEGSLAELGYALKVGDIPATLFGMALAHVAYPVLAWNAAEEQLDRLKDNFALAVRMSLLINVPMAIGVIALSVPIVELLFARGSFSGEAVRWTAWTLAAYTIGMPMRGARAITMHALWALKDSRTPMVLGLRNVIYNIVFNLIFMHFFGVAGLALSTSLVNTIFLAGLMWRLRLRLGGVGGRAIASTALRILAAAGIMGGAVGGTYWATSSLLETLSEPARLVNVLAPIAVGAVVYGAAVFALRVKEAAMVLDIVKKKLGRSP